MTLRFLGDWHPALGIGLATLLALFAWRLSWRETHDISARRLRIVLPTLRALAVFLITLTLTEPVLESRVREGEPGRVLFAIDNSQSMTLHDTSSDASDGSNRFSRASDALGHAEFGLLRQLTDTFDITVNHLYEDNPGRTLWDSRQHLEQLASDSADWQPSTWSQSSPLGDSLTKLTDSYLSSGSTSRSTVVVLMSDGQSNAGKSPLTVAQNLKAQGTPVFTVGFGSTEQREDIAIRSAAAPQRVFPDDTFAGSMTIAESVPLGTRYTATVRYGGTVLWERDLVSQDRATRRIEFSFPVQELVDAAGRQMSSSAQISTLPVKLDLQVQMENELSMDNNQNALFTTVANQEAKIFLIDGRSRWETRYLKNMFSRDPGWDITSEIVSPNQQGTTKFPATREELFQFNLVILGDVRSNYFTAKQLAWLHDFVEQGAGGLVLIDGARGHLQSRGYRTLQDLLPVEWPTNGNSVHREFPKTAIVTSAGGSVEALQIESAGDGEASAWSQLPPLEFVSQSSALAGSEVLVEATSELDTTPLMVFRRFGAGRVLYVATDETWRWRYKVADLVHTRLWNQLARWIMRTPLSLRSEFVSLDSGRANYDVGQLVEIRCRLRDAEGDVNSGRSAIAIVKRGTQTIARMPFVENPDIPGSYRAETDSLRPGDYSVQVEAAGFPQHALELQSRFSILTPQNIELQETTCNEELLKKIARESGGAYVHEDQIDLLVDYLNPISGGRYSQSVTILWQSYWWFIPAISLLVTEWLLRKRAGLV